MISWAKKLSVALVTVLVLYLPVGVVSAQNGNGVLARQGVAALIAALADETGSTPQGILAELRDSGADTLADFAIAYGIDPATIITEAEATTSERINQALAQGNITQERADTILAGLTGGFTELMTMPLSELAPATANQSGQAGQNIEAQGRRILLAALTEATGMELRELLNGREEGTTLAEVAEANGVDPEDVVSAAVAVATEQINQAVANERLSQARADQLLANLETTFTEAMNRPFSCQYQDSQEEPYRPRNEQSNASAQSPLRFQIARELTQAVSDATGLDLSEMIRQTRRGATLGEIAEANNADLNAIVATAETQLIAMLDEAVNSGNLTEERVDLLQENLTAQIWNVLNGTRQ